MSCYAVRSGIVVEKRISERIVIGKALNKDGVWMERSWWVNHITQDSSLQCAFLLEAPSEIVQNENWVVAVNKKR